MKVQKTSTQPTFQPIEIKITIESQEELEHFKHLCQNSSSIYNVCIDQLNIDSDAVFMLEGVLDQIGECL